MKDNIKFINSIQYPDFQQTVTRFFDEHMALYNLVGSYTQIQNISGILNGSSISFKLDFLSNEDAQRMSFILQNKTPFIFDRYFQLVLDLQGSSLIVHFV